MNSQLTLQYIFVIYNHRSQGILLLKFDIVNSEGNEFISLILNQFYQVINAKA